MFLRIKCFFWGYKRPSFKEDYGCQCAADRVFNKLSKLEKAADLVTKHGYLITKYPALDLTEYPEVCYWLNMYGYIPSMEDLKTELGLTYREAFAEAEDDAENLRRRHMIEQDIEHFSDLQIGNRSHINGRKEA